MRIAHIAPVTTTIPPPKSGSVETMRVRWPLVAARTAVAAATVVLPTPPLPVNSRIREGKASPLPEFSRRGSDAATPRPGP